MQKLQSHTAVYMLKHLVSAVAQTHSAQTLAANLLNVIDSLEKVRHECLRVLSGWEVTKTGHGLVLGARDLVCSLLR